MSIIEMNFEKETAKGDNRMQKNPKKPMRLKIFGVMLAAAMAVCITGCSGKTDKGAPEGTEAVQDVQKDGAVLGEGEKKFDLTIADQDGEETRLEIHTDQETVGAALTELGVIEGEEGDYGLYVTTVNGITADYETDGVYWAFYINNEYAQTGVDATEITEGDDYSFRIEQ